MEIPDQRSGPASLRLARLKLLFHIAFEARTSKGGLRVNNAGKMWIAVLVAALVISGPAFAQSDLTGTTTPVNTGPGDQTDPHVSGDFVAYTSNAGGINRIRTHDLSTSSDAVVPNNGEDDFLSDISGNRIVFTRLGAASSIYTFTIGGASASEVAPAGDVNRRNPAIGSSTVAWQDFGFSASMLQPEIVSHNLTTGVSTRLTNDALLDRNPSVSPDGSVVVWAKCQTTGTGCDIWMASGGTALALTGTEGEESVPDTNGSLVVYASARAGETDIFYKSVSGGAETRLALVGTQSNPSISGSLIAFDHRDAATNWDVMVYDTATSTLYRLTSSTSNETLNDIWSGAGGFARVVYASDATGDSNVYAVSFQLSPLSVAAQLVNLASLVQGFNLKQGIANSFDAKLQNALKAVEAANAGDRANACNLMTAFINETLAQSGKALTTAQAAELVAAAEAIRTAMGCP